jgi:hypothetical protein
VFSVTIGLWKMHPAGRSGEAGPGWSDICGGGGAMASIGSGPSAGAAKTAVALSTARTAACTVHFGSVASDIDTPRWKNELRG